MATLISVIIPTYNRANLVLNALNSVINQTYKDLEIIVVDDASLDNTEEAVKSIRDSRIIYVRHLKNLGGSATRNTGIEKAKGEVIAFLDDDDSWDHRKLEKQIIFLNNYDAVCTAAKYIGSGSRDGEFGYYHNSQVLRNDLRKSNCLGGSTSSLMVKTVVMKNIRFDVNLKKSQDWDLFIRILDNNFKIGFLNEPLVYVSDDFNRMRISTKIQTEPLEKLEDLALIFDKHREFFGHWFYNYNRAKLFISYIGLKKDKRKILYFAIRKTNLIVVLCALLKRLFINLRRW